MSLLTVCFALAMMVFCVIFFLRGSKLDDGYSPDLTGFEYRNRKNGRLYKFLYRGIDCTNSRVGTPVVVYMDQSGKICVREESEFNEKFDFTGIIGGPVSGEM
jgi:hypothetical protein